MSKMGDRDSNFAGKHIRRVRLVVVTLRTTSKKLEIIRKKNSLEFNGIYIKEDYTPEVLQKRK